VASGTVTLVKNRAPAGRAMLLTRESLWSICLNGWKRCSRCGIVDVVASEPGDSLVTVRSASGTGSLTIDPIGGTDTYRVSIRAAAALGASVTVELHQRFEKFFSEMARDWRGWDGERIFSARAPGALADSLRLGATADGRGHVRLIAEAGQPWLPEKETAEYETHIGLPDPDEGGTWAASVCLVLEAGQLAELAADTESIGLSSEPSGPRIR
jgi:hypothetical protein